MGHPSASVINLGIWATRPRRRGRPKGSRQDVTKEAIKIRLDADVMAALRASGDGWQTRINDALRASLALSGKIVST